MRMRFRLTKVAMGLAASCVIVGLSRPALAVPTHYVANLTPLNNSGVTATFNLTLDGTMLTVNEHATGLVANEPHPQHIHGLLGAAAPDTRVATAANDIDHDGYVELAEGQTSYGPILLDLTSPPGGALADFPTAPGGTIDFSQTYDLSQSSIFDAGISASDLFPLTNREIVIHGLTVPPGVGAGTPGEVNGTGGYLAVLPVADGMITLASPASVPEPATLSLLTVGIAGIFAAGRNRAARRR